MENFLTSLRNRYLILLGLLGLIFLTSGVFLLKSVNFSGTKVEILNETTQNNIPADITVEIAGEVVKPGVYKLPMGSRVEDLLVVSGGFSVTADRVWADKYLNRALKLSDSQKIFIPEVGKQSGGSSDKSGSGDQTTSSGFSSDSSKLININSASLGELDSLPGIGQVYGQKIIEYRPYSNVSELQSKGVLGASLYNKIKDLVSIY